MLFLRTSHIDWYLIICCLTQYIGLRTCEEICAWKHRFSILFRSKTGVPCKFRNKSRTKVFQQLQHAKSQHQQQWWGTDQNANSIWDLPDLAKQEAPLWPPVKNWGIILAELIPSVDPMGWSHIELHETKYRDLVGGNLTLMFLNINFRGAHSTNPIGGFALRMNGPLN